MSDNSEIKNVEAAPGENFTEYSLAKRTFFTIIMSITENKLLFPYYC